MQLQLKDLVYGQPPLKRRWILRSKRRRIDLLKFNIVLKYFFPILSPTDSSFAKEAQDFYIVRNYGRFVNRPYERIRFYFGRPMSAPTIYSCKGITLPNLSLLHYYLLLNYKPLRHFLTKMPPPLIGRLI